MFSFVRTLRKAFGGKFEKYNARTLKQATKSQQFFSLELFFKCLGINCIVYGGIDKVKTNHCTHNYTSHKSNTVNRARHNKTNIWSLLVDPMSSIINKIIVSFYCSLSLILVILCAGVWLSARLDKSKSILVFY